MKNLSKTIIFFGTDSFSLDALQRLIDDAYNIIAVVTKPDSKSGRGHKLESPAVKKLAIDHGIEVWQPSKVTEINDKIIALNTNICGVLVSYGKIIPKSTINLFKPGIINVHPSLLPLYRGPSPIESVIANGDKETGVSIMKLSPNMDAGPVYIQEIYKLLGNETRIGLRKSLSELGSNILSETLAKIIDEEIKPADQDEGNATYCKLLTKKDALVNPKIISSITAERLVRAHLVFPKTKIKLFDKDIIITKAHISTEHDTELDVLCNDKKYLSIDELIAPSGRTMKARDFLNGYS